MINFDPTKIIDNSMRPIPFWSWNDKLSVDELRNQIRLMHKAGFGGFFMHARGGLQTKYMSQEWLDCVIACVDEAEKFNMEAWLYDENGWPSGYADGKVNGLGEDYQQKFIVVHDGIYTQDKTKIIAVYRKKDGRRLNLDTSEKDVYTLYYQVNPCYIDVFNPQATDEFIKNTHQYYYDNLPKKIRENIKGIFTDEPQIVIGKVFYSRYYAEEFKKHYGTDLFDDLIKIWYDFENCEEFRAKYYRLAGELFAENYTRKIHDWCKEHNWLLTGHLVQEINYAEECFSSGAVSYHYPFFDIVGIDHLGRVASHTFLIRQMTSVAAQFGIKRRMVEIFACLGWDLNFDDMRYYYHILQLQGVNFLCHHLFAYSLRGLRKRDYPPSFGTHVPYFEELKSLNDEFSRTNQFIAEGEEDVSTLVIHAQGSVWANYHGDNEEEKIASLINSTDKVADLLDKCQTPFHFGFEPHIEQFGEIVDGFLKINKCSYQTIVFPEIDRLSEKTYKLLREFKGEIYRTTGILKKIGDRDVTPDELEWFKKLPKLEDQLSGIITLEGENKSQIRSNCFKYANGNLYMIINHDNQQEFIGKIKLHNENGRLFQVDGLTGETEDFFDSAVVTLKPAQAIWIFANKNQSELEKNIFEIKKKDELVIDNFYFPNVPENYLFLDKVRYRINDGKWQTNDISVVQWELLKSGGKSKCDMEFEFFIADDFDFSVPIYLLAETPQNFTYELNGQSFEFQSLDFVFDKSIERAILPAELLKKNRNILALHFVFEQSAAVYEQLDKCRYFETAVNSLSFDMELEPVYLAGNFAVAFTQTDDGDFVSLDSQMEIANFDKSQKFQDFISNSLPFWAGKTVIQSDFQIANGAEEYKNFICELVNINAIRVWINDQFIGLDNHNFCQISLPENILKNGRNSMKIEIISNLRNFMGPFHVPKEILTHGGVTPGTFGKVANVFTGGTPPLYLENYCVKKTTVKNIKIRKG